MVRMVPCRRAVRSVGRSRRCSRRSRPSSPSSLWRRTVLDSVKRGVVCFKVCGQQVETVPEKQMEDDVLVLNDGRGHDVVGVEDSCGRDGAASPSTSNWTWGRQPEQRAVMR